MKVLKYKYYKWRAKHTNDLKLKSHYRHMAKRALYK